MTEQVETLASGRGPARPWPGGRTWGSKTAAIGLGAGLVAVAVASGVTLVRGPTLFAAALCAMPLVIWLFTKPGLALVFLGASIPFLYSFTGGRGGFNLSISDLFLVLVGALILFEATVTDSLPAVHALRPIARPLVQYGFLMLLLLVLHLSIGDIAKTGQRFELFLVPLVIGAFAALTDRHVPLLKAYVVAATALAVLWPLGVVAGQKNPVGQMIANAILVLVGVKALRRYVVCAAILVPGLVLTVSKGAILATAIGLIVILSFQRARAGTVLRKVAVLAAVAFAAYAALPPSLQSRLTTLTPGVGSVGAYALHTRQQYAKDAEHIIAAHRWIGIGVGNYLAGDPYQGTQTTDPHDVLLLQAAEGGYVLAIAFALLIGGSFLALRKMGEVDVTAAAAGVLVATVVHGLVDVYWVRGTPILSWLLVGMACGGFIKLRQAPESPQST
jgi:O-Antigen ligase